MIHLMFSQPTARPSLDVVGFGRFELYWWDDQEVPSEMCETEPLLKGSPDLMWIETANECISGVCDE